MTNFDVIHNLRKALTELAGERRKLVVLKNELRKAEDVLHDTVAWADFKDIQEDVKAQEHLLATIENGTRQVVVDSYAETGNRNLIEGAKIRIMHRVRYDLLTARNWAMANAPDLLMLDTKRFEKGVTEGVLKAPATIEDEVTATIATDLDFMLTPGDSYVRMED